MPIYEYRCPDCGPFESVHPMASVPRSEPCPVCSGESRKVFTAVGLSRTNSARAKAIGATEKSAHEPDVVSGPVGRSRSAPVTTDPRHAKLPRP